MLVFMCLCYEINFLRKFYEILLKCFIAMQGLGGVGGKDL